MKTEKKLGQAAITDRDLRRAFSPDNLFTHAELERIHPDVRKIGRRDATPADFLRALNRVMGEAK